MTSTRVVKEEDSRYRYIFEILKNVTEKHGTFSSVTVEQTHKIVESFFIKSLLGVLKTYIGDKQVIIGLGPGRCGTMSLAFMLGAQKDILVHHESEPGLDWDASIYEFIGKWASLFYYAVPPLPILADIANWYLPFVPYIYEVNPTAKFVCLRRDIEKIVTSFMLKVPTTSHWTIIDSKHWHERWERGHHFRKRFPKYDLPKEEGCRCYIEEYYTTCEEYAKLLPNNFRIFDIETLNTESNFRDILEFCGVLEEEMELGVTVGTHLNQISNSHKETVRKFKDSFGEDF